MPIRRTFRRLWTLVIRRPSPPQVPSSGPGAKRNAIPPAPPPQPLELDHPLTTGAVRLRVWAVGPYVVVAGTHAEAARALDRLAGDHAPGWGDEARRLREALRPGGPHGDALRVAV